MASKVKKNRRSTFEKMNMHFYSLKIDDDELFKNMLKRPVSIISPLKSMLNFEVDRLSLQQLEYEMDRTDYPVDYNFLELEIVVTLTSVTKIFNSSKPII